MYNTITVGATRSRRVTGERRPVGAMEEWNDSQPIYRQLRDRVVAMVLDGALKEGDPLPSVRTVASELRVNPLTVLKAYDLLTDERLVEKRRGVGIFVSAGARDVLLQGERARFLSERWPEIRATIERLGLADQLLGAAPQDGSPGPGGAHEPSGGAGAAQDLPGDGGPGRGRPPR